MKVSHFQITLEFDLKVFPEQKDEMRRFQRTLEDITETIFNDKIKNLETELKKTKLTNTINSDDK